MSELSKDKSRIRKDLKETSKKILQQIKDYGNFEDFPVDSAERAISYGWSINARLEEELQKVPEDEDIIKEYENEFVKGKAEISAKQKLLNYVKRLEAKVDRVHILTELQKANKSLISQMGEQQKIIESKERSKYIAITTHAAQLAAFQEMFFYAMRKCGYSEIDMTNIVGTMKDIQKEWPVIEEGLDHIYKRLYGEPKEIITVEYETIPDSPKTQLEQLEELDVLAIKPSRRSRND